MKINIPFFSLLILTLTFFSCNDIVSNKPTAIIPEGTLINLPTDTNTSKYDSFSFEALLQELSEKAIVLGDFDFDTLSKNWIGFAPANTEKIEETEKRLGLKLPEDYKNFLKITNGFPAVNEVEPSFLPVSEIDHLVNVNPFLVSIWGSKSPLNVHNGDKYDRALIIGGVNEEQHFFLIPPIHEFDEWEYWEFASWSPGESPHDNLQDFFKNALLFCDYLIKENENAKK
ncbi:MAG: hypothetical protein ACI8ZM_003127 [Crocinitomix sp.]|jgi:hypothetical protein